MTWSACGETAGRSTQQILRGREEETVMIFISHSSVDAAVAAEVCGFLEGSGKKCFIAPRDIRSGMEYAEELINAIDRSNVMVLLMSKAANSSPHVLREVERAVSKNIPILVCKLEDLELSKSLEYFLMTHQWIDQDSHSRYEDILTAIGELEATQGATSGREQDDLPGTVPQSPRKASKGLKRRHAAAIALTTAGVCLAFLAAALLHPGQPGGEQNVSTSEMLYEIAVGDTISFGSYCDEPIQWRVLRMEERDGRRQAVLVSKYILTMKAFDAAESGKYNHDEKKDYISRDSEADTDMELQAYVRGNSCWQDSNIRTWLNAETEVVTYEGQAPLNTAMSERHNGYQNEPGFLYGFTEQEREMLTVRECRTPGNALAQGDIVTYDRVFLLSLDELAWFDEAGISKLAEPTPTALEQDTSQWYEISVDECGLKEYCWWLRTPVDAFSSKAYLVENGYGIENDEVSGNLKKANVGLEGYGIRPAVTIDLDLYVESQREK